MASNNFVWNISRKYVKHRISENERHFIYRQTMKKAIPVCFNQIFANLFNFGLVVVPNASLVRWRARGVKV